jgi:hypothetical protein
MIEKTARAVNAGAIPNVRDAFADRAVSSERVEIAHEMFIQFPSVMGSPMTRLDDATPAPHDRATAKAERLFEDLAAMIRFNRRYDHPHSPPTSQRGHTLLSSVA